MIESSTHVLESVNPPRISDLLCVYPSPALIRPCGTVFYLYLSSNFVMNMVWEWDMGDRALIPARHGVDWVLEASNGGWVMAWCSIPEWSNWTNGTSVIFIIYNCICWCWFWLWPANIAQMVWLNTTRVTDFTKSFAVFSHVIEWMLPTTMTTGFGSFKFRFFVRRISNTTNSILR